MFCLELPFDPIDVNREPAIIECYYSNIKDQTHPSNTQKSAYRNLWNFKDKEHFFKQLFSNSTLDPKYFNFMSIQRITGDLPPHVDVHRKLTAMYTIKGLAETSFYNNELEEISSYKMKLRTWYLFNNGVHHGVRNIIGPDRISLTIDLTEFYQSFDQAADLLSAKDRF